MNPVKSEQIGPMQPAPELEGLEFPPILALETGSGLVIAAWIIQQLVRALRARADRDGGLLEASSKQQFEQSNQLIDLLAADQERMHTALIELRESIDALTRLIDRSSSLTPSKSNPNDYPVVSLPSEPDRQSD